ncbi:hypothetical protein [Mesorhizobium sp. M0058]|uniref:hypothetical protein n=1 Tax=Mesorhizobium sp. M0058 TaxID=2956865 RepID=UPI00333C7B65
MRDLRSSTSSVTLISMAKQAGVFKRSRVNPKAVFPALPVTSVLVVDPRIHDVPHLPALGLGEQKNAAAVAQFAHSRPRVAS